MHDRHETSTRDEDFDHRCPDCNPSPSDPERARTDLPDDVLSGRMTITEWRLGLKQLPRPKLPVMDDWAMQQRTLHEEARRQARTRSTAPRPRRTNGITVLMILAIATMMVAAIMLAVPSIN